MQLKTPLAAVCLVLALTAGQDARADGLIQLRNAYYKEQATRVVQPMIDVQAEASDRVDVNANVLLDAITSASEVAFNERRYEVGGGADVTLGNLRIGGFGRYSTEMDYRSLFAGVRMTAELAKKNTTLGLVLGLSFDDVTNEGARGSIGFQERGDALDTRLVSASISQLVSPNALVGATYDLISMSGFMENPYRLVPVAGLANTFEEVPETRLRHAMLVFGRYFLEATGSTFYGSYRLYTDNWEVTSHTPEFRIIQELVPDLDLHLRYQYHTQGEAYFFQPTYDEPGTVLRTSDVKLSSFTSQVLGVKLDGALSVLGLSGRLGDIRLDVLLHYVMQRNRFGNAVVFQTGMSIPFGD